MKIIICGAGQVGTGIAERLSAEGNDVSIIDASEALCERANEVLDVRAVHGNAAHPDVLERAGAADADMLVAVTLHDEVNMVACQVAHTLFNVHTRIARVRAQAYLDKKYGQLFSRDAMAIDHIISPEIEVGTTVLRRLELPGAFETATFADQEVMAVGIYCGADCPVLNTPLSQLSELFPDLPAVVVALVRDGNLIVPRNEHQILEGDDAYLVLPTSQVARTLQIFGHEERQARRIVIAGGGNIGLYLAKSLEKLQPNARVKVIEQSRDRAVEIAEQLDRVVVLHGSALSEDMLREAEIGSADTLVAVTNDEQANLLTAALSKQLGCGASLALINSANYGGMIRSLGIDAQINPRSITVSRVLQHVRRGRIRGVHSIHNGVGEIIEAEVLETAAILEKPLGGTKLTEGVRFGAVVRNGKVLRPTGETELEIKDRVIMFVQNDFIREVEQMFRVRPDYF
ncbi:MAG: Trk system potassium transporter TrkA [Alphaproteobacteria bacterium]|nr:Trk system potassium transporter TrkA [Alphaproteobacteria bacterium]